SQPEGARLHGDRSMAQAGPVARCPSATRQSPGRRRRPDRIRGPAGRLAASLKQKRGQERGTPYCNVLRHIWLMSDATVAAPNPLSILTTETPEAQLFSIPKSAATPPKLAP